MDDIQTVSEHLARSQRPRQSSESGNARPFGSQKSLKSTKSAHSGSKGSQINMLRKNSVTASHGLVPTIKAEYGIDEDDVEMSTDLGAGDAKMSDEEQTELDKQECRKYMKNLLLLCTGFFFIFTSFLSLRNLQSSLNAMKGLGMYTLSCTYAFFFLGCIFATSIVQRLGPKRAIVVATIGPLMYDFAYFMPTFYTMVPAGGLAGFAQGVIWTAHATYIANIAVCYANLSGEKVANVLSKFNGIFFVFYQSCQIVGGIIASIILKSPSLSSSEIFFNNSQINCTADVYPLHNNSDPLYLPPTYTSHSSNWTDLVGKCNNSLYPSSPECGREYCHWKAIKSETQVEKTLVYILVSVFTALTLTGIAILVLLLDPLEGQMKMKKDRGPLPQQLLAVFKFYNDRRAVCLFGIMFYSLLQAAFLFGEFNKAFVTCSIGIEFVGFIMMVTAFASANAAFWNGRIQKYSGRIPLLGAAFCCQAFVLVVLLLWTPNPDMKWLYFLLVVFWGIGDGTIMTQDISLIGYLFSHNKEPAFAALKMTQSLANFTFFISGPYMCTISKIFFIGTVLIVATVGYLCLEVMMRLEVRKLNTKSLLDHSNEVKA